MRKQFLNQGKVIKILNCLNDQLIVNYFCYSLYLALICALLLGFCDGLYETQINEFIAITYKENSSAPFSIFVSLQALGGGTLFYLSNYIGLHVHLIILTAGATIGTLAFYVANKLVGKRNKVFDQVRIGQVYQITENFD